MGEDYGEVLASLAREGRLRELIPVAGREGCRIRRDGRTMLNLSSNDYLGLAGDKKLHHRFYEGVEEDSVLERFGLGAASSRLLSGDCSLFHTFEEALVSYYGLEAALLYNSGYHANIGVLPALCTKRDLILSDKLNHASLHDGLRLTRANVKRYRHLDYDHLESLLAAGRKEHATAVIVTESVFSMDGDVADLTRLVDLKKKYDCLLYVDEAHGIGLYGKGGLGMAAAQGVLQDIDILVGPMGKAWGSMGAFVLSSKQICSFLVNHSRTLIFTTALPPVVAGWSLFVLKRLLAMDGERDHLQELSTRLRDDLIRCGLETAGTTNIVPVLIGDNQLTVDCAKRLQAEGYLVLPVRPPTVPEGTARFRLSLTADMRWSDIAGLAPAISSHLRELRG